MPEGNETDKANGMPPAGGAGRGGNGRAEGTNAAGPSAGRPRYGATGPAQSDFRGAVKRPASPHGAGWGKTQRVDPGLGGGRAGEAAAQGRGDARGAGTAADAGGAGTRGTDERSDEGTAVRDTGAAGGVTGGSVPAAEVPPGAFRGGEAGGTGAGRGGARPAAGGARTGARAAVADRAERLTVKAYASDHRPTWCPGCGDFGILNALKKALVDLEIWPHEVMIVSGIGCGSKLPDYINANGFMTIHGRPLAVATGIKLANPKLHVIVVHGDGDGYGIGGNHWLHTMRRNIDLTDIVENNQIYALTKGQYSPTSERGFRTTTSPAGAPEDPVLPTRIAFATGATFIARAFAGQPNQMAEIFAAAIRHKGYALVDVLQPCVTFNKVNTYDWYAERAYSVDEEGHDPTDPEAAWEKCNQWGDRIPIGILWRNENAPPFEERIPGLTERPPVVGRPLDELGEDGLERLKAAFF